MRKIIILLLALYVSGSVWGQASARVDSLLLALKKAKVDTVKVNILNQLALETFTYDLAISKSYCRKANDLAQKCNFKRGKIETLNHLGRIYVYQNKFDSSIMVLKKAVALSKKYQLPNELITSHSRLGIAYMMASYNEKASKEFFTALKYAEKYNNLSKQQSIYVNLSALYLKVANIELATKYSNLALRLSIETNNKQGEALSYISLSVIENYKMNYRASLEYQKKSLEITQSLDLKEESAITYISISNNYFNLGKYQRSIDNSLVALEYFSKIENLAQLSQIYINLGKANFKLKNYNLAYENLNKAKEFSMNASYSQTLTLSYLYLSRLDSTRGDYKNALFNFQKYKNISDSSFFSSKEKVIAEIESKYQLEKKETENTILREREKANKARISNQRIVNIFLIAIILVFVILIVLVIKGNFKIKRINNLLVEKNTEIKITNDKLEEQNEEIELQKSNLVHQNQELVEQKKLITSSIKYALKIQMAVLPDKFQMDYLFSDYFIFFKPFQIVSGDFYWLKKINHHVILAVGDCTGHGVPGAFLSMLGISSLSEVVNKYESLNAADILNRLRNAIKKALKQNNPEMQAEDGMDIALCVLNTQTMMLQYAGAHRPLYLVVENSKYSQFDAFKESSSYQLTSNNTHTLIEVKPDKQPIGVFFKETSFTNHELQINKGDSIYLFTDGYTDQFDENEMDKFSSKKFKELLLSVQANKMRLQKKVIKQAFESWKSNAAQTDDVLVVGLKL